MQKHKKNTNKKLIFEIIIAIIIITLGILIFKAIKEKQSVKDGKGIVNQIQIEKANITEEKTERMLQLEELQKENSDIIGYLEIQGTNISYPVLQTTDNDFYMKKNYKKEYSKDGSIFLDKDYNWEIPSSNLLIYGHNNKNGQMFCDLLNYKDEKYYEEHPTINFTTNKEEAEYEIIAVFLSRVYYKKEKNVFRYYYFINAENEEEYNSFVENCKKESLYDTGKTAKYGDQLITLSTCSYHVEDGRFAVVGRKIKNGE
jgi:sortase B